ncbi:MAG: hypothetical protein J5U19_12495 [Candidatus Methanoperedens sp.]|nr:hypothetical protein [Candidatus Methanoperedens sp.]
MDDIYKQLRYGFRLPDPGEWTFFVGCPKYRLDDEFFQRPLNVGCGGEICYPMPSWCVGLYLFTPAYLQHISDNNYIKTYREGFIIDQIWSEIKNQPLMGHCQRHYVQHMIEEHNKKVCLNEI